MRRLIPILAAVAVLAGCGGVGGGGGGSDPPSNASSVVPSDALGFVAIDTDLSSDQLKSASAIVDKFPGKDKAIQALARELKQSGLDLDALQSSVGSELDVAALAVGGKTDAVGFA